jgi:membrane protein implicated in regulation of membrane protease activity
MSILDISFEWWYWLVFGFVLLLLELQDGSFLMLGLGVAAASVGGLEYILDIKFTYQLLIWALFSVAYIFVWKKYLNGKKPSIADSEYSAIGIVVKDIEPHKKGIVKFDIPVFGSREWKAMADMPIHKGESVKIVKVIQQTLKVEPLKGE